ncbi:DUF4252 domain-containing protein [Mesonia aestuariivivens]|uniref:DUF4252 domain-containing protein n=1 Tax=Mesonia aestuariivivens TaxID=2796128 RepID=A0ABS6VYD3_9FLAO|nr:DUF4252 domain-containing protein [Mesonia aestuariivivens]MBW2960609.1 DUF4252 domain-containing protein [Mesonia aestuariivivens]
MKNINKLCLLFTIVMLVACNKEPSLQKYYVEHQDDNNFVMLDVPSSLFLGDNSKLSEEDQKVIQSIKKANVLALPVTENKTKIYLKEKNTVESILNDEKYKVLMRFGSSGSNVRIMYLGDKDAIDEIIVYANDETKGFAVARLLGDDMNFSAIMNLMKSASKGDVNINLNGLGGFLKEIDNKSETKTITEDSLKIEEESDLGV